MLSPLRRPRLTVPEEPGVCSPALVGQGAAPTVQVELVQPGGGLLFLLLLQQAAQLGGGPSRRLQLAAAGGPHQAHDVSDVAQLRNHSRDLPQSDTAQSQQRVRQPTDYPDSHLVLINRVSPQPQAYPCSYSDYLFHVFISILQALGPTRNTCPIAGRIGSCVLMILSTPGQIAHGRWFPCC